MNSSVNPKITSYKIEVKDTRFQYFADLGGVKLELELIHRLCEQAESLDESNKKDMLLIDAIGIANTIRYIRCFHSFGKRKSLTLDDIKALPDDYQELHNTIKKLRDKHIAHAVNHFEECYCEAYIEIEDGIRKPFSQILTGSERVIFSKSQIWALKELVSSVLNIVYDKLRNEEHNLLEILNSLSETEINTFKPHKDMEIDFDKIDKASLKQKDK